MRCGDHLAHLSMYQENMMAILIQDFTGRTHFFRAFPSDTIMRVKKEFYQKVGLLPDQHRLVRGGMKQMIDDRTVRDNGVSHMTLLQSLGWLRGGKPVILLYPPHPLDASVHLSLDFGWEFSTLYPAPSFKGVSLSTDTMVCKTAIGLVAVVVGCL